MVPDVVHRACAILISLVLVLGVTAHGARAAGMNVPMAMGATVTMPKMTMSMPDGCEACLGDDGQMAVSACFATCAGMTAVLPAPTVVGALTLRLPAVPVVLDVPGRHCPPDPYPPRPTVLS